MSDNSPWCPACSNRKGIAPFCDACMDRLPASLWQGLRDAREHMERAVKDAQIFLAPHKEHAPKGAL